MAISTTTSRSIYDGDGSTTTFATGFRFIENSHVQVILIGPGGVETTWVEGTQYILNGAGEDSGGTVAVILGEPDYTPAPGEKLVVRQNPPNTQESKMPLGGAFPSTIVEQALDLAAMRDQQLADQQDRALRFPISDVVGLPAVIPNSVSRAGKVLAFDDNGVPIVSSRTLEEMEQLTDSDAAESALAAAASAADALAAQLAAEAAAGSVDLPSIEANKWLRGNATGDAWEMKSDAEMAEIVGPYLTPFTTGDGKLTLKAVADAGWVMMNDGTIGNAASGATTRANADCESLFKLLWANVSNSYAAVSGGRGGSADADWTAGKTIALTKQLGRAICVAGAGADLTVRALGETLGVEFVVADLAAHTHGAGSLAAASSGSDHDHTLVSETLSGATETNKNPPWNRVPDSDTPNSKNLGMGGGTHPHTITGSTASTGSGGGHLNVQPSTFWNVMVKL